MAIQLSFLAKIERENNELRHRLTAVHVADLLPQVIDNDRERDEGEIDCSDGRCPCGCDDPDQPAHRCVYAGTKYSGQMDEE